MVAALAQRFHFLSWWFLRPARDEGREGEVGLWSLATLLALVWPRRPPEDKILQKREKLRKKILREMKGRVVESWLFDNW